jgi:hypothetical protein
MYSWEELKQVVDSYKNKKYRDNLSYVEKNSDRFNPDYNLDQSSKNIHKDLMKYYMLDKNLFKNRNKEYGME